MTEKDSKLMKYLINNVKFPVIIKNNCKWPLLSWTLEDWSSYFKDKEIPFRCKPELVSSSKPCWERECSTKHLTFKEFVQKTSSNTEEWMYFDYKHLQQWATEDSELFKQVSWNSFGFPDINAADSTMWVGSKGAHTPCHQDTYGRNIVVQVYGRKRWLLFPPQCENLRPTRVPYEESSIYSEINFAQLENPEIIQRLHGAKIVDLEPGDALIVPPRWWHYVEHISPIAIAINTWLKSEDDDMESLLEEALVRFMLSQLILHFEDSQLKEVLNPNEDDFFNTPLSTTLSHIEITAKKCIHQRGLRGSKKRQKISERSDVGEDHLSSIEEIIQNCDDIIQLNDIDVHSVKNVLTIAEDSEKDEDDVQNNELKCDEVKDNSTKLVANIINSFCDISVISNVKENLLKRMAR